MCFISVQFLFCLWVQIQPVHPQAFFPAFSLLSPPNFSIQSITSIIFLCKDRGSSIRTHVPLCHTSFKCLYHFPIGRNSNWWHFHLSSLSMLCLGKRWWFQIAHYLFPTQAQVRFQHHLYRDPDFPQSHNVLWAVLQSRRCIIMFFGKLVMWIVRKQAAVRQGHLQHLSVSSQSTLVRTLAQQVWGWAVFTLEKGDCSCIKMLLHLILDT